MEDVTIDPDDPAAWLWSSNDASLPNPNTTWNLLQAGPFFLLYITRFCVDNGFSLFSLTQPRSSVPAVASASSSVSPSPFAPPSRSSPLEPESNMTAISITGPSDDPAPVFRENDGQTDPTRKFMNNDVEMRIVTHYGRDIEGCSSPSVLSMRIHNAVRQTQPPLAPVGVPRRSTSSQSRVPSHRMS
ncbi:hypothetical protein H4582DRAFT_362582 [Lactarius indigo]|nr:hypothetical protein H4582DRAFT_362582 [Lactarius indigo]